MKFTIIKKLSIIQLGLVSEVLSNESNHDTVEKGKIKIECNKWLYLTINFINQHKN